MNAWHCPTGHRRSYWPIAATPSTARRTAKAAAEKGLKLQPPRTWEELDALARFFQGRDWDGDGQPGHGIALVLGDDAEGLGNATFLARAASLGQHPDQFSFVFDSGKRARASDRHASRSSRP